MAQQVFIAISLRLAALRALDEGLHGFLGFAGQDGVNCPEGFAHGLNGIRVLDVVRHRTRRNDEGDEREDEAHEQAVKQADQPADLLVPLLELLFLLTETIFIDC